MIKKSVTAIILVAGNSTRYGKNRNKNFEIIGGKTVLSYSLEAFDKNLYVDNIVVAIKECDFKEVRNIIDRQHLTKNVDIIIGGNSRKQSVYNCIKAINSDIVIIHDGARPLIKQDYITNCILNMKEFKGVTIGVKSKDTIKIADDNNIVLNTTNRNNTWIIQTPQCFERTILKEMDERYLDDVTDDCSLLERGGYQVKIIAGSYSNIKITTAGDLEIIKNYLKFEGN